MSAIDPSDEQVKYARGQLLDSRVTFQTGDALSLPFANHTFDVAAMALVINFVSDGAKAVAEMKRVIKPHGTVGAYVWDNFGGGFVQRPLVEGLRAVGIDTPAAGGLNNTRIEELRNLFKQAGIGRITTRSIEIEVSYPTFDDYWSAQTGFINPIGKIIRKMSEADVTRLQSYLRDHLPLDRAGRVVYAARANAVKGQSLG